MCLKRRSSKQTQIITLIAFNLVSDRCYIHNEIFFCKSKPRLQATHLLDVKPKFCSGTLLVRRCCLVIFAHSTGREMKILMVCLGNICRSPLAEGILRQQAKNNGLNWKIDSAGTSAYHTGEPPHRLSQKVARLHGIDISGQKCRQFTRADMQSYDMIYVMDEDNYKDVKKMAGTYWQPEKVQLLLGVHNDPELINVPDPWYGTEEGYHRVYEMIDKACHEIILSNNISI